MNILVVDDDREIVFFSPEKDTRHSKHTMALRRWRFFPRMTFI